MAEWAWMWLQDGKWLQIYYSPVQGSLDRMQRWEILSSISKFFQFFQVVWKEKQPEERIYIGSWQW